MDRVFVWLLRLIISLAVMFFIILCFMYYLLSRSLPDYDATTEVRGLTTEIEIVRDTGNVPHIFGTSNGDTMFGLGYAHAQDRLWQMTMMRRTAQGRLSELFGVDTLPIDLKIRRLGIYEAARKSLNALRPETKRMLDAYAKGVNARLAEINDDALGRGAPEFFIFSNSISPWQPADSLAILKLIGVQLSSHLDTEVLRKRITLALGDSRVKDILPDAPGSAVSELEHFSTLFPNLATRYANIAMPAQAFSPFKPAPLAGASNAWAAMPGRSAAGKTLLANDPHSTLEAPSIWYLARLELETGGVIGGTVPGIPAVLLGRSTKLGWGLTSANLDDVDIYVEKLNPQNSNEYLSLNGYTQFIKRQSIINVKGSKPVTVELLWTENGPVLDGSLYNLQSITPEKHVMSIAWTLLSSNDTSFEAAFDLMTAVSVQEALEASKSFVAPSQNLILADSDQIAMRTIGALPKRNRNHETKGRMPSRGWILENRWDGIYPPSVNPLFLNPVGGVIGNSNNKFINRPFPKHITFDWTDTQRVQRWRLLMERRSAHTRDSFVEAQLDTVSPTARALLPLIGSELWFQSPAAPSDSKTARRQTALALLANWNGEMNEHMPEPLIYSAWTRALQKRLIQDELGPLHEEITHVQPVFIERVFRNVGGASRWCDVVHSVLIETCAQMASLALEDALTNLTENYGSAITALRWGDVHQATHKHPVLGKTPIIKWFVNIEQSTSGGDNTLQRGKTIGTGANPYLNVHAGAYRGVYDFADPNSSVFIISTGQSGHPLSRFYDNLGTLWRRGEYLPMSLDESLARAASAGITRLIPAEGRTNP